MGLDYYGILNVKFDCDIFEIHEAFRRAVIKFYTTNKSMLCLVCEAYEVLSDPGLRTLYNHFGEEGLKGGILTQPYVFHGQTLRTVQKFFGTLNSLEFVVKRVYKYDTLQIKQVLLPPVLRQKDPPMHKDVFVTLEEIFFGGHKDLLYTRREYDQDMGMVTKEVALKVPIDKGILTNTMLIFKNQSNLGPVNIPGDLIITIRERPHERFLRAENNLIQRISITLKEAFTSMIIPIETLDGRKLRVRVYPPLNSYWSHTVDREGLPICDKPGEKGDLILTADIKMPAVVPKMVNEILTLALESAEEKGMFYEDGVEIPKNPEDNEDKNDPCTMVAEIVPVESCLNPS